MSSRGSRPRDAASILQDMDSSQPMSTRDFVADSQEIAIEMEPVKIPTHDASASGLGILGFIIAIGFIFLPFILPAINPGIKIEGFAQILISGFGVILLIGAIALLAFTHMYYRTAPDVAFVRTGLGGPKIVIDGGAMIASAFHKIQWVALRTMQFKVVRAGRTAVITKDFLRANMTVEFFVKVTKEQGPVHIAATSLADAVLDPNKLRKVIEEKLESAIRQSAAEMDMQELLSERQLLIEKVKTHVDGGLRKNGLELEDVTVSMLDQTPAGDLDPENNIFDAQGVRKINEITTAQSVETNKLKLSAQRQIQQETVATNKYMYEQELERASAEAQRDQGIQIAQAQADQLSRTQSAELNRQAQVSEVERDRDVEIAKVEQQKSVEVAGQQREQSVQTAQIAKDQAIQIANRLRDIQVAEKEKELADAQAQQLLAEAIRTENDQKVATVQAVATAEREKQKMVISAEADAGKLQVQKQMDANVAAYTVVKQAEAEQDAAKRRAEARLVQADADQKAKALQAQGDQAIALVPVNVSREQVEVNRVQVDVNRQDLANKAQYETISKELSVQLAQIEADRDVQIASANAAGSALAAANIQIIGDPDAVGRIMQNFYRGRQAGALVKGVIESTPPEVSSILAQIAPIAKKIAKDKLGIDLSDEDVRQLIEAAKEEKKS